MVYANGNINDKNKQTWFYTSKPIQSTDYAFKIFNIEFRV